MKAREHARVWFEVAENFSERYSVDEFTPQIAALSAFAMTISEAYARAAEKDPD